MGRKAAGSLGSRAGGLDVNAHIWPSMRTYRTIKELNTQDDAIIALVMAKSVTICNLGHTLCHNSTYRKGAMTWPRTAAVMPGARLEP